MTSEHIKEAAILDVYKKHFGDVSFSFDDAPSWTAAMRLPYAVPSRILLPDSARRFDIGYVHAKTGRLHASGDGAPVFCLFDTHLRAASEMASAIFGRRVDLERLLSDLDDCAEDVLYDAIDLGGFNLLPTEHRAYRLGPASFGVVWARRTSSTRFRPPSIEFRGASVWIVSATLSTSRLLLDPFGAISKATARDIVIEVGQS